MDNVKYVKLDIDKLLEISKKKKKTIKKTTLNFLLKNLKGGAKATKKNKNKIIISKIDDYSIIETFMVLLYLVKVKKIIQDKSIPEKYKNLKKETLLENIDNGIQYLKKRFMFLTEKKKYESYFKTLIGVDKYKPKDLINIFLLLLELRTAKKIQDKLFYQIFDIILQEETTHLINIKDESSQEINVVSRNKKINLEISEIIKELGLQKRNKKINLEVYKIIKELGLEKRSEKLFLEALKTQLSNRNKKIFLDSLESLAETLHDKIQLKNRNKKINTNELRSIINKNMLKPRNEKIKIINQYIDDKLGLKLKSRNKKITQNLQILEPRNSKIINFINDLSIPSYKSFESTLAKRSQKINFNNNSKKNNSISKPDNSISKPNNISVSKNNNSISKPNNSINTNNNSSVKTNSISTNNNSISTTNNISTTNKNNISGSITDNFFELIERNSKINLPKNIRKSLKLELEKRNSKIMDTMSKIGGNRISLDKLEKELINYLSIYNQ